MEQDPIYVAGGLYGDPATFQLVRSDYRQGLGRMSRVALTDGQKAKIRESIETNYFFD